MVRKSIHLFRLFHKLEPFGIFFGTFYFLITQNELNVKESMREFHNSLEGYYFA